MLAGAEYYAGIINNWHVPPSDAAMVYSLSYKAYVNNNIPARSAKYQNDFDNKLELFDSLVNCLGGGEI